MRSISSRVARPSASAASRDFLHRQRIHELGFAARPDRLHDAGIDFLESALFQQQRQPRTDVGSPPRAQTTAQYSSRYRVNAFDAG